MRCLEPTSVVLLCRVQSKRIKFRLPDLRGSIINLNCLALKGTFLVLCCVQVEKDPGYPPANHQAV